MIEFFPPDARLYTDGRIWRWLMINGENTGVACHRSRSLLIATLSLWWWTRKARRDVLPEASLVVFAAVPESESTKGDSDYA